jgi:hypothetical protein
MTTDILRRGLLLAAGLMPAVATADDLRGTDRFLCSVLEVTACAADVGCDELLPADLNMPQFVVVDLAGKKLATTAASGENRTTALQTIRRESGLVVVQGNEAGRAFSLLIDEATGRASFASAAESRSVTVFAACTPQG